MKESTLNTVTEQVIFEKYPTIFKDKDLSPEESCMAWGLEVPDDWLPIIDELCYSITSKPLYISYKSKFPQVVAEQVKEKFNSLRFYYRLEFEDDNTPKDVMLKYMCYIDGMIAYAESRVERLV